MWRWLVVCNDWGAFAQHRSVRCVRCVPCGQSSSHGEGLGFWAVLCAVPLTTVTVYFDVKGPLSASSPKKLKPPTSRRKEGSGTTTPSAFNCSSPSFTT